MVRNRILYANLTYIPQKGEKNRAPKPFFWKGDTTTRRNCCSPKCLLSNCNSEKAKILRTKDASYLDYTI